MKKLFLVLFMLVLGISVGTISAQSSYEIPSWVKGIASFWVEGNITDEEFGEGLAFLIDSGTIKVPKIKELEDRIVQLEEENRQLRGESINISTPIVSEEIAIRTDDTQYSEGDAIIISGNVSVIVGSTPVTLQVFTEGNLVEIVQVTVAQNGSFSHTIIAEGPLWNKKANYVVRASYGEEIISETSFLFVPSLSNQQTTNIISIVHNQRTFDVPYSIHGGKINNIEYDSDFFGLIIDITTFDDGTATFDLHQDLIRADRYDGQETTFIVLIDGIEVAYREFDSSFNHRKISVNFEQGDSEITIVGTFIETSNQKTTQNCDTSYPDVCIAPYPPDLNCGDIGYSNFRVIGSDPHGFDRDNDGIGCES